MKEPYPSGGFTIIESMIFLVVSVGLFGSVVGMLTQQVRRNEFAKSVEAFEVRLQDALNDVSTGFYSADETKGCRYSPTGPEATPTPHTGSQQQGANIDCIFVGKAFQFAPSGNPNGASGYSIYSMIGNRTTPGSSGEDVVSLAEAKPKLATVSSGLPGFVETGTLIQDVEITKVVDLSSNLPIGGIALVSTFATKDSTTNALSGNAARVKLHTVTSSSLNTDNDITFASKAEKLTPPGLKVASAGVLICIREAGTNGRKASVSIGTDQQDLRTFKTIDDWPPQC